MDVRCTLGHSVRRFRSLGLKSIGCDISTWATKKAKKMNPSMSIVRADAFFLPFKSRLFDVTTAFETLEHHKDLDLVLNVIKRATKSNGLVLVSVPATDLNDTMETSLISGTYCLKNG